MALVARFDTPASLRDAPAGSAFYDNWHDYLAGKLNTSTPGSSGGEFYDPSEVDVAIAAERLMVWMGFPRARLVTSHRDDRRAAFIASEARNLQEEYCEWRTERDGTNKITKITVVTETPEYWEQLAVADAARVLALYQQLIDPSVQMGDLFTAGGAYNRQNRWNTTDGIVHFIQSINTLDAALGLSQRSVYLPGVRDNFEAPPLPPTSVDPRVNLEIAGIARRALSVTLREPIGLYIAGWDDTGWTKPDGTHVGNYWRIVRGSPGMVLRLEYEVPAAEGFAVGDIRIGGRPIEFGGQITEHITCVAGGTAGTRTR